MNGSLWIYVMIMVRVPHLSFRQLLPERLRINHTLFVHTFCGCLVARQAYPSTTIPHFFFPSDFLLLIFLPTVLLREGDLFTIHI